MINYLKLLNGIKNDFWNHDWFFFFFFTLDISKFQSKPKIKSVENVRYRFFQKASNEEFKDSIPSSVNNSMLLENNSVPNEPEIPSQNVESTVQVLYVENSTGIDETMDFTNACLVLDETNLEILNDPVFINQSEISNINLDTDLLDSLTNTAEVSQNSSSLVKKTEIALNSSNVENNQSGL